jgi:hypothetical protein
MLLAFGAVPFLIASQSLLLTEAAKTVVDTGDVGRCYIHLSLDACMGRLLHVELSRRVQIYHIIVGRIPLSKVDKRVASKVDRQLQVSLIISCA